MKRMKDVVLLLGVSTILVLLVSGCATPTMSLVPASGYSVTVNSITDAEVDLKDKTYILLSSMKKVTESDLQFKEFAKYIENALSKTGYKRVDSIENANLTIGMAYGIGNPKTEISTKVYTTSTGYSYPIGWTWIHVPPQTEKVTTKTTTYMRYLVLVAYDSKNKKSQFWKTTLQSEGTGNDLRVVIPHMIAAAIYEFGTNTESTTRKSIYKNAARALDIKQSYDTHSEGPDHFAAEGVPFGVKLAQLAHEDKFTYYKYVRGKKYYDGNAGVLVTMVTKNSVAEKMGLKKYDVIVTVNNNRVNKPIQFFEGMRKSKEKRGGKIQITFFSWDKLQEVSAAGFLK